MASPHLSPTYDAAALNRLRRRTEYESWLAEETYDLSEEKLFPGFSDAVFYAPRESVPRVVHGFGAANFIIGDWRPEFRKHGAPLIFVSLFKLLDMLVEWVLGENGFKDNFRFSEKLKSLQLSPKYPPAIENRPWLKERLEGLYRTLDPLRGTIIHREQFSLQDGTLHLSASRPSAPPTAISIDQQQLRTFALVLVLVVKEVTGSWSSGTYREKFLRHQLDALTHMHLLPLLGQRRPHYPTVRVYTENPDPHQTIEPSQILDCLSKRYSTDDCMFDLRVVTVSDRVATNAFLFRWDELVSANLSWGSTLDAKSHRIPVPDDVQEKHLTPAPD